ncbi:septal ring lytic transglycosylase RlpA family protein [Phenylobacterium sp. LjRoot225]|uniref:septal ring lytic transglycosylase RlpA family protein n=1 Tax=Phenylobacterium sp. LjRoot225 TaxID=3342285 RepID=UPI003ECE2D4B
MQIAGCVRRMALITAAAASLAACASVDRTPPPGGRIASVGGTGKPYQVNGIWYVPREEPNYNKVGTASWYGAAFHRRATASGELFDMNAVSAAHTTLPLPSIVEVTNLDNGRRLKVRVNDRGPFVGDRIIDLSREAARELGYERNGLARVRVRYVGPAPLLGREAGVRVARASPPRAAPVQLARNTPPPRRTPAQTQAASASYQEQAAFTSAPAPAASRTLEVLPTMAAAPSAAFRVQAGAFSEEARARRAAAQLASVGPAVVEPVDRDGTRLWRVMLPGPQDELQAYNLRQRVADAGFADARVVGPF